MSEQPVQNWRQLTPGAWVLGAQASQIAPTVDYSRYQSIKVETREGIAILTINRPEKMNAVDAQLHSELARIWQDIAQDQGVRAVVLTAAGRVFCGGPAPELFQQLRSDRSFVRAIMEEARQLIRNMLEVRQPIIAAVNGDALSLGATLVLFCDIIIAADTARLADTHVRYGVVAGDGGAIIWPLLVGIARAKEFLLTGDFVSAGEAERIGLINHVVPADQVMTRALEIARRLASGPPQAIQGTKLSLNKVLWERVNLIFDTCLALEEQTIYSLGQQATQPLS